MNLILTWANSSEKLRTKLLLLTKLQRNKTKSKHKWWTNMQKTKQNKKKNHTVHTVLLLLLLFCFVSLFSHNQNQGPYKDGTFQLHRQWRDEHCLAAHQILWTERSTWTTFSKCKHDTEDTLENETKWKDANKLEKKPFRWISVKGGAVRMLREGSPSQLSKGGQHAAVQRGGATAWAAVQFNGEEGPQSAVHWGVGEVGCLWGSDNNETWLLLSRSGFQSARVKSCPHKEHFAIRSNTNEEPVWWLSEYHFQMKVPDHSKTILQSLTDYTLQDTGSYLTSGGSGRFSDSRNNFLWIWRQCAASSKTIGMGRSLSDKWSCEAIVCSICQLTNCEK